RLRLELIDVVIKKSSLCQRISGRDIILNKGTVVYAGPIPNKPTASDETQSMASMEITLNE
ncbi:hypothetical protein ACE02G_20040, partial [Shewanella xiamenensis]|uniref:hypothetical protein n=1 Tax=Shewanella xiamenensis TaxID=332186 RepID=UPI0035B87FF2